MSAGTAQAGFWDWFNVNKANNDSQQAATIANAKATSTSATIKVISPNGGEVWKAGTKKNIVFKGNLIKESVFFNLHWGGESGGNVFIGESITSGNGKASIYSWTIPVTTEPRNDYKISVRYPNIIPAVADDKSDKPFTIKNTASSSSRSNRSSATTTPGI